MRRLKAPRSGRPFRYLDLGCGGGFTATALAAANPQAEIVGVDFSPDHVLEARELAEAAGAANVRFVEASFADLLDGSQEIGRFDIIACHGVYSWVTPDNRRRIVEILRRSLRTGGLAYLGYNAMPGWAPLAPVRRLVGRLAQAGPGSGAERAVDEARAILAELHEQGVGYAAGNAVLGRWLERFDRLPRRYLAHEYLPEAATALWHDDVAAELSAARLRFVGSARLAENFDSLDIPAALRERVAAAEARGLGETVRDLVTNRTFRMDVFARGGLEAAPAEADRAYDALPVALAEPPPEAPAIHVSHGETRLAPAVAGPVLGALAEGPAPLAEVVGAAVARGADRRAARQAMTALLAGGLALPLETLTPDAEARAACARFNAVVLDRARAGAPPPGLASPLLGGGLSLAATELRLLAGAAREPSPGRPEQAERLRARREALEARRPCLQRLGVLAP